jgi:hypothetical protein
MKDPRKNAVNSNTIAPIILINRLKICVMDVVRKILLEIPIPVSKV